MTNPRNEEACILLSEEGRRRLADYLADKPCPAGMDPEVFRMLRHLETSAITYHDLSCLCDSHGASELLALIRFWPDPIGQPDRGWPPIVGPAAEGDHRPGR